MKEEAPRPRTASYSSMIRTPESIPTSNHPSVWIAFDLSGGQGGILDSTLILFEWSFRTVPGILHASLCPCMKSFGWGIVPPPHSFIQYQVPSILCNPDAAFFSWFHTLICFKTFDCNIHVVTVWMTRMLRFDNSIFPYAPIMWTWIPPSSLWFEANTLEQSCLDMSLITTCNLGEIELLHTWEPPLIHPT